MDIDTAVRSAIRVMMKEKRKSVEHDVESFRIAIHVSKRQISISVYTMRKSGLPLPLVDKEIAMVVYDLRTHTYPHSNNADILKKHVMDLFRIYKTGKLNLEPES